MATPPFQPAPIVNTTGPLWSDFNNATNGLNGFLNAPDPYMQLFQQQRQANELTAANAIASATAASERAQIKTEQQQQATTAGLETYAAKTGLAPNSAYQLQVMQGAQDQFSNRFALIDQEEKLAIAKAKAAQRVGDTDVLREQLEYANTLRQEKARALEKAQEMEWEKYKFNNLSAAQKASEARLSAADAADAEATAAGGGEVFDNEYFTTNYSTGKLFRLAQALGVPRERDQTRQGEIQQLMVKLPALIAAYREAGKTDEEIKAYLESLM